MDALPLSPWEPGGTNDDGPSKPLPPMLPPAKPFSDWPVDDEAYNGAPDIDEVTMDAVTGDLALMIQQHEVGALECVGEVTVSCVPENTPSVELANGLDDDCANSIDE